MRSPMHLGAGLFGLISLAALAGGGETGEQIINQIRVESYRNYLVNDLYTALNMDRSCGDGPYGPLARDRVFARFESFGLPTFRMTFDAPNGPGENVFAIHAGTLYPDSYYLVSAHLDNVANGGADDDASGVAALLELARVLSAYETDYSIRFLVTDYEESGLRGAIAYCASADAAGDDIVGVINLDMIAWNSGRDECRLFSSPQSLDLKNALADSFAAYGVGVPAVVAGEMPYGTSDHAVYEYFGHQALVVMERDYASNPYLHTFHDTIDLPGYPHYDYATEIVRGVAGFLADHAGARPSVDCNENGQPDELEIQANPELDCNGDAILDACEFAGDRDANGNGVPDLCDIASGASGDCNGNWIPDDAEAGYAEDCDENGVPDLCEIADFSMRDFNHNQIPDVCEGRGTLYVDDDAPADPGPNDTTVSDPLEDGTPEHPYDAIGEALAAAFEGDEIVLLPGTYSGEGNQNLQPYAKAITFRGSGAPEDARISLPSGGYAFDFNFCETRRTVVRDLTVSDCARASRGAVYCDTGGPTFANCVFENNRVARGAGGAVYLSNSDAAFLNCLFAGNSANGSAFIDGNGGAVAVFGGNPEFVNCTFANNRADDHGGTLYVNSGQPLLANSIISGGSAPLGAEFFLYDGTLRLSYSNLAAGPSAIEQTNGTALWGLGNITVDPGFIYSDDGDYRLGSGSPCIDAACNLALPPDDFDLDADGDLRELWPLDLDAAGRFADDPETPDTGCGFPVVDMGAYEYGDAAQQPCPGDFDGNRTVDLADLAYLLSAFGRTAAGDLDCDGVTDLTDLAELLGRYGDVCP